jgi:hypothetical protein
MLSEFYEKSPLPSPETLGMLEMGASFLTEMFPDACVCGRPLAFLSYKAAIECSSSDISGNRLNSYKVFAEKYNLALCCRTRVLSPVVSNIVSSDIGARRIEFGTSSSKEATNENAPSPGTNLPSSSPPFIINQSRQQ